MHVSLYMLINDYSTEHNFLIDLTNKTETHSESKKILGLYQKFWEIDARQE